MEAIVTNNNVQETAEVAPSPAKSDELGESANENNSKAAVSPAADPPSMSVENESGTDSGESLPPVSSAETEKGSLTGSALRSKRLGEYLFMGIHYVESKIASWQREADELQKKYPDFPFEDAFNNPSFKKMLACGVSLEQAFRATHLDFILEKEVERAKRDALASLLAKESRPIENGMAGRGGINVRSGASTFSKNQRAELAARVFKGEKIKL